MKTIRYVIGMSLSLLLMPAVASEGMVVASVDAQGRQLCKTEYRAPNDVALTGIYSGECVGGLPDGTGTVLFRNGDKLEGQFRAGLAHGNGSWRSIGGDSYRGAWRQGLRHGQGTYLWAAGSRYAGEWAEDKRHGSGTYTWANGSRFEGTFADNRHRNGTYRGSDGRQHRCRQGSCQ